MIPESSRSIRQFYRRIRKYFWLFMAIFAANAIFSIVLFTWIVNSGLNDRAQSWSTYFKDRTTFLASTITSASATSYGFDCVIKVTPDGTVISSKPEKISIKNIAASDLFRTIKRINPGENRIVQFRNIQDPALKALYLVKREKKLFVVGLLNSKSLLPMIPRSLQLILYNSNGEIQFSTLSEPGISKADFDHGLVFHNGKAYAVEHSNIHGQDKLNVAVIKNISKEFYGLVFLTFLTLLTLTTGLMRSAKISSELMLIEAEFQKINSLLSGVTSVESSDAVSVIMKDVADDLRAIDWDKIADNTIFQENRMYLQSTAFFTRNMVHLLDAVSEHSKALSLSEEKYRELVNRANSIILRMDINGRITFFNEFAQSFFGYSQEELLGKKAIGTIVPKVDTTGTNIEDKIFAICSSPEITPTSNNENMRKDGSRVWVHWTNSPVYQNGELVEILCVGMDTTERRKAILELEKAKNYIKNIIDSMPSVVISVDKDSKVNHFNLAASKIAGLTITEIQNSHVEIAFPDLADFKEKIKTAILTCQPDTGNMVTNSSKGILRYEDIMIFPLTGGTEQGAVIRIDDVTERVRIEEIMIQTEKMMSVGGLAAGMAHEINNPLGGILQGIQNIIRRLSPELKVNREAADKAGCDLDSVLKYMDDRKIMAMLNGITESGIRAANIVSGMLEFSRKSDSKKAPGRLETLLDKTINLAAKDYDLKKRYDFKQIEIVRNYEPNIPQVLCCSTEIEQVFLNLLRNSAQAMTGWDEMKEAPRIEVSLFRSGKKVCCKIKDNGPGMDDETRKRVFEPFFTTKDPGVGTGLGLSVSYFIITKNHNGTFEVHSKPGKGTSFTIMLPAAY